MKKILAILIVTVMLLGTLPAALPVSAATIVRCEIEAPDYIEPGETITVNYITTFDSEPTDSDRGDLMFFNSLLYGGTPSVQRNVSGNTFTYSMTIPVSPEQALGEVTFKINYRYSPIKKRSAKVVNFDKISTWSDLETALKTDGNYKLTADVRPDSPYWADALVVPSGVDVVLDLNGHIIDRGYTELGWDGSVIKISGNLTLLDSSPAATHEPAVTYTDPITGREMPVYGGVLKGGWPDQYGGGVQVQGGTFDMKGGSIACNSVGKNSFGAEAALGGGVYMQSGTFNMSGGAIVGNKAVNKNTMMPDEPLGKGGAVYIAHGTFTLTGGLIRGNCAGDDGGAVYVGMSGAFVMTGGIIVGNVSNSINNVSNIDGGSAPDMVTSFLHSNDGNDYTSEQEFPSTVDTTIATDVFVRDGYEFKGWAIAANSNAALADGAAFSASGDGHLWAKWEKNVTTYPLWIGETEVTSANFSGEGWSFEPETNTLTLDGFTYSGVGHSFEDFQFGYKENACAAISYFREDLPLNVTVIGENSVTQTGGDPYVSSGIYALSAVSFSGGGKLDVTAGSASGNSIAVYTCGSFSADGVKINAYGGAGSVSEGICTYGNVNNIKDCELYAESGMAPYSVGIYTGNGTLTVDGGKLTVRGANSDYTCIGIFLDSDATFKNCTVDVAGGEGRYSCGVSSYGSSVTIENTVKAFVVSGSEKAIENTTVKNAVAGTGWDDAAGTGGGTEIPVNTDGASLAYKKVEFPSPDKYDLWVGGEQVTSRNLSGEGWSYDPSTGTLTLNSFNYSGIGYRDKNNNCSPIYSDVADGLTLDLKGTSTVEEKGDDSTWLALGVYSKGKLTVTGNGTINATGSGGCHNIAIYSAGDIVIDGGTVNAVAGDVTEYDYNSYGIYSIGSITINGGTVKGTGGAAPDAYSGGFFAYYDITVNGGSVTGTGGSARYDSWGLFSYYGNISINEVSGEKPTSVVAAGNSRAIESIYVKSSISGMGWNDASGEGDGTFIPVNTEGTSYDYRKVVFPHVHSFTAQTVGDKYLVAAATCTEPASYYKSCSICGEAGTETFTDGAALGHDYKAVVTEPTCTEGGYTTHTCSRCGDAYTDNETGALGHDMGEWQTAKEPTCLDAGMKKCECSRCDYFEEEPVDALGHDYKGVVTDPTCTDGGFTTHTCSRCGDTYTDTETDALGHDYKGVVTDPTCTDGGFTTYTCERCGDTYTDNETEALGHDMGEWKTTLEPTCTEKGTKIRYCSRCDYSEDGEIDPLGHDFAEKFTEDVAPTEETEGSMSRHCSRCDATTDVTEIPKILRGDVNGDGKVNMKDVLLLRKVLAGSAELELKYFRNSILDGEESISLKDLLALRVLIAGA